MKISDHLVQSLYFLPCGGSNRVYKPLLSICFIYYVSIMVHISFTMVHFPLPIINHICHAALIDTCLNYYPYFIDTCHMHQGFQKSVG